MSKINATLYVDFVLTPIIKYGGSRGGIKVWELRISV